MATLDNLWTILSAGSILPAHTRVSADHPLELFAQIDAQRRQGLLALSDAPFDPPPVYSAVDLVVGGAMTGAGRCPCHWRRRCLHHTLR